ncbi:MAG TPA: putative glycoside hydrolase [Gaiellaceae bacterium]
MVLTPVDPNERFRLRRDDRARKKRRRRISATLAVALLGAAIAGGVYAVGHRSANVRSVAPTAAAKPQPKLVLQHPRPLPAEVRGVHVTMALASIPGRLEGYMKIPGLNAVELDVKDESGRVGFVGAAPPLARATGASGRYYDPKRAVALSQKHGVYLIGRVVCFEDPVVSEKRPQYAIRTRDGGVWHNRAGLGWANPYNRGYWDYIVAVGAAAARAGFDEIQLDYVRFPTDGDLTKAVFPGKRAEPLATTIASFVKYVATRLRREHVRVSADVFGLSAARDLGIGQVPRRIGPYLDAIYPMVYPSHYVKGEYALDDPTAAPGLTVARSLADFRRRLRGQRTKLIPWLQDFSLGRTYTIEDVRLQIAAARRAQVAGFMLWNAGGVYTNDALSGP